MHLLDDYPQTARNFRKFIALAEAQNWRCCYCSTPVDEGLPETHADRATTDHVIPCGHGGLRFWSNEVVACFLCNSARGTMNAMRFFGLVQKVGRFEGQRLARYAQARAKAFRSAVECDPSVALLQVELAHKVLRAPQLGVRG